MSPGTLGVGAGDGMVRVWDTEAQDNFQVRTVHGKLNGAKVLCLA